jgi:hypothetical protein
MDSSEAHNVRVRVVCARALRVWRRLGDRERAKWFRRHIYFVGFPFPARWFAANVKRVELASIMAPEELKD